MDVLLCMKLNASMIDNQTRTPCLQKIQLWIHT